MNDFRELFHTFALRFSCLDKNCCKLNGDDISVTQSHILYEIKRVDRQSMQEIADQLTMDITTLSRQVQSLTLAGFVEKRADAEDRRISRLSLSLQGEKIVSAVDKHMNNYLNEVFSHMNEFEQTTVIRALQRLNDCMAMTGKLVADHK